MRHSNDMAADGDAQRTMPGWLAAVLLPCYLVALVALAAIIALPFAAATWFSFNLAYAVTPPSSALFSLAVPSFTNVWLFCIPASFGGIFLFRAMK